MRRGCAEGDREREPRRKVAVCLQVVAGVRVCFAFILVMGWGDVVELLLIVFNASAWCCEW